MAKTNRTKEQISTYKILVIKLDIEQREVHLKPEWTHVLRKGSSFCSTSCSRRGALVFIR